MHRMRTLVALMAILIVCGCGGSVDKLGQAGNTALTLSALSAQGIDEVAKYGAKVEELSGGRLRLAIEVADEPGPGTEPDVVDKVRSGAADVGFAGTRVWPGVGSHALDALLAPLLIDSYALEEQVLTSDLVDDMTSSLNVDGITGLGVIPGPLRYIAGRAGPMRRPDTFAGTTIGISEAAITRRAIEALGAKAVPITPGSPIDALDGIEAHLGALVGNNYQSSIPFVTDNLPMWPRSITAFMNRSRFDSLSEQQRSWLLDAGAAVTPSTIQALTKLDAEWLGRACRTGARLESATTADRSALEAALRPVIDELRADPSTATALDAIAGMRSDGPARLACDDEATATQSPKPADTPVDGTWTSCPSVEDILAAGGDPGEAQENDGCFTITLDGGVFREAGGAAADARRGSYSVEGDQLTILRGNGERFEFTFGFYRDEMILTLPADPDGVSPAPMRALPFSPQGG